MAIKVGLKGDVAITVGLPDGVAIVVEPADEVVIINAFDASGSAEPDELDESPLVEWWPLPVEEWLAPGALDAAVAAAVGMPVLVNPGML